MGELWEYGHSPGAILALQFLLFSSDGCSKHYIELKTVFHIDRKFCIHSHFCVPVAAFKYFTLWSHDDESLFS